jgi:2-oxoglutarate dehydrogenase E1 component
VTSAPRAIAPSVNGWNAEFLEAEYQRFRADPASVPADLAAFFRGFDLATAGLVPIGGATAGAALSALPAGRPGERGDDATARFQSAVDNLIDAYRDSGHLAAKLDPFGRPRPRPPELSLQHHGLSESDLDRTVHTGSLKLPDSATLRSVVQMLEETYCGSIGFEVMHVESDQEQRWLLARIEGERGRIPLSKQQKAYILEQLLRAEELENFIQKRYADQKRFSLEGSESTIPLLDHMINAAADMGVEEFVLGMAHRGRLNVLNHIMGKTYEQIFTEFEDNEEANDGGDVKYHRGYSGSRVTPSGKTVHLAMASNPSHLESVDAVVEGRTRAKQRLRGDLQRLRVIPVLIHGDGALPAQGVVAEVLNLAYLDGYTTGGTIHAVINNLIAFTTSPEDGRSTPYCTDVAKMIAAPVFHVNGEDPEAVIATAQFAVEYRQKFKRDVFIDLYCYRKYGHNEQDEATFTQPLLYALIRKKASVLKVYAEKLLAEGVIAETDMSEIRRRPLARDERRLLARPGGDRRADGDAGGSLRRDGAHPGGFQSQPQAQGAARGAGRAPADQGRKLRRLRVAGVRHAPPRGDGRPRLGPGLPARHLQPPARGPARHADGGGVPAPERHARAGQAGDGCAPGQHSAGWP